jgi:hypothetical protein
LQWGHTIRMHGPPVPGTSQTEKPYICLHAPPVPVGAWSHQIVWRQGREGCTSKGCVLPIAHKGSAQAMTFAHHCKHHGCNSRPSHLYAGELRKKPSLVLSCNKSSHPATVQQGDADRHVAGVGVCVWLSQHCPARCCERLPHDSVNQSTQAAYARVT